VLTPGPGHGGGEVCTVGLLSTGCLEPPRRPLPAGHALGVDPKLYALPRLRAAGYTDAEVRRMQRTGDLTRLRSGIYIAGAMPDDEAARHALLVRAALEQLSADVVVSHVSAAVLHGLPVWNVPLDVVHVTRDRSRTGARRGSRVHVHSAPLAAEEVVRVNGILVTSLARTVADLARTLPFEQAVVLADGAMWVKREDPLDRVDLLAVLDERRWPGTPAARRVAAFADGRSHSLGESLSRIAIQRAGLPKPVLQWEVRRRDGTFVGEVDFGWPELRTVGEFDGKVKYGVLVPPGEDLADVLYREKLREDAIRAEVLGVVRWGWRDLSDFTPVANRLRQRFGWSA
jgi:hypothetical protein